MPGSATCAPVRGPSLASSPRAGGQGRRSRRAGRPGTQRGRGVRVFPGRHVIDRMVWQRPMLSGANHLPLINRQSPPRWTKTGCGRGVSPANGGQWEKPRLPGWVRDGASEHRSPSPERVGVGTGKARRRATRRRRGATANPDPRRGRARPSNSGGGAVRVVLPDVTGGTRLAPPHRGVARPAGPSRPGKAERRPVGRLRAYPIGVRPPTTAAGFRPMAARSAGGDRIRRCRIVKPPRCR